MREIKTEYISSNGEVKDVRNLDIQYLINALAKSYRKLFEFKTEADKVKYLNNINNIQDELGDRIQKILFEGDKK